MSYCATGDIYPLVPTLGTLTAASQPSLSQASALVDTCAVEIDGVLKAAGYDLPITDSDALTFLASVNAYGAAAFILKAKYPQAQGVGGDGGAASFWEARYADGLATIRQGGLGVDQPRATGTVAHGFRDSGGSALSGSDLVPRISRETEF